MRPRFADDHATLAAVARHVYRRQADYLRARRDAGTLTTDQALEAARVLRAVAHDWAAIAALGPEPDWINDPALGGAWAFERRDALTDAAIRAREEAAAADGDAELSGIADAVDTLLWWEGQRPTARMIVDATLQGRAEAAQRRVSIPRTVPSHLTLGAAA
jgi:hypothetical protein